MPPIVRVGRGGAEARRIAGMAGDLAARLGALTVLDEDDRPVPLGHAWESGPVVLAYGWSKTFHPRSMWKACARSRRASDRGCGEAIPYSKAASSCSDRAIAWATRGETDSPAITRPSLPSSPPSPSVPAGRGRKPHSRGGPEWPSGLRLSVVQGGRPSPPGSHTAS